jgi:hypothetical protein
MTTASLFLEDRLVRLFVPFGEGDGLHGRHSLARGQSRQAVRIEGPNRGLLLRHPLKDKNKTEISFLSVYLDPSRLMEMGEARIAAPRKDSHAGCTTRLQAKHT